MENVGLIPGHHLGQDIGVGEAHLEGHGHVGIGVLAVDAELFFAFVAAAERRGGNFFAAR